MDLTKEHKIYYSKNGYLLIKNLINKEECEEYLKHIEKLNKGEKILTGFQRSEGPSSYKGRTFNQHLYDSNVLKFLIHPKLKNILEDCFGQEAEGIQTMHFFQGSEHPLHQDQYYLPDCMSAWIAMEDVNEENGPLCLQPQSHLGRLITKKEIPIQQEGETYEQQQTNRYFPIVKKIAKENNIPIINILEKQGDVLLFHGRLIHGGSTILKKNSTRHALACHYIPYTSCNWDRDWPRISFDGTRRVKYNI